MPNYSQIRTINIQSKYSELSIKNKTLHTGKPYNYGEYTEKHILFLGLGSDYIIYRHIIESIKNPSVTRD